MNKIRMLKDLEAKELEEILFKNNKMIEQITECIIRQNRGAQTDEAYELFGYEFYKYIDIKKHYDTFYLVLKDWKKFIDNLNIQHLNVEGIEKYNEIKKEIENAESFEEIEEDLEKECEKLLKICENMLHSYEEYPERDEIFDYFINNEIDYVDYYVNEKDVICLNVAYTKYYN